MIVAVHRSADPRRVVRLWAVNRLDFMAGLATFVLVLVWETLPAMIVGVVVSLAFLVRRASFPDVVELGVDGEGTWRAVDAGVVAATPGTVVVRFDAPLLYANAQRLRVAARTALARRGGAGRLVLDGEMMSDLDTTGADVLATLDDELADAGVELHLARIHRRARTQIARSDLARRFAGRIHPSLESAVGPIRP